jgi:NAD(P)-dependent dehydrogenase (short-subunit alcohol dehydrogenase family)
MSRVCLISGAGGGIGHVTAVRLGLLGYRIAAVDIDAESSERTAAVVRSNGGDARSFTADVADEASVDALMAQVVAHFGALHCAVNNAGVIGKAGFGKTEHWTPAEFDSAMLVNARGVFLAMRAQIRQFRKQPAGADYAIVNVASFVGLRAAPGQCGYGASKAAVVSLTKTAAVEYAPNGIRVNCVCPSIIAVGMGNALPALSVELTQRNNPSRRPGEVFEVVNAIEFLLDAKSTYISGVSLPVDAAQSAK